jgi:hypothetical protein
LKRLAIRAVTSTTHLIRDTAGYPRHLLTKANAVLGATI